MLTKKHKVKLFAWQRRAISEVKRKIILLKRQKDMTTSVPSVASVWASAWEEPK